MTPAEPESGDGQPFITPPPRAPQPSPDSRGGADAAAAGSDASAAAPEPETFISLPPGVVDVPDADSGTHRARRVKTEIAEPATSRVTASPGEITFFPTPIGAPAAVVAPTPTPEPAAPAASATPEQRDVETGQSAALAWRLGLPGGDSILVDRAVFVGRNPSPTEVAGAQTVGARLVSVIDPAKTVSKTHALFVPDGTDLHVVDLNSTNGVHITAPGGPERAVTPGERAAIADGARVELGDFGLDVSRA